MKVQITQQAFFDLVNKADKDGTPYSFTRAASVNDESARWHIVLVSDELNLEVGITRSTIPSGFTDVTFRLDLGSMS